MSSSSTSHHCIQCGTNNHEHMYRCSRCKLVRYCSRQCQQQHWSIHGRTCTISEFMMGNIPSVVRDDSVYVESYDTYHTNLLIMLPGMDTNMETYVNFVHGLKLPQTSYLVLHPIISLPFHGFSWYPMFNEDGTIITVHQDNHKQRHGLRTCRTLIHKVIRKCGWPSNRVFLCGFSGGSVVAVDAALTFTNRVGGVLAMSSLFLSSHSMPSHVTNRDTPILVMHGDQDPVVPLAVMRHHFSHLCSLLGVPTPTESVESSCEMYVQVGKSQHTMVSTEDEVHRMMTWFSKHLVLRSLELEQRADIVEIQN